MIKDDIYAWLDNTGAISDALQAHLDHNLKTFGSMFYPPASYNMKYPPSEIDHQISKGFLSYFANMLTDIMKKLNNDNVDISSYITSNATPISNKQFNNEYASRLTEICKNKSFTPRTLLFMLIPTDFGVNISTITKNDDNPLFTELITITNTISPIVNRYLSPLTNTLASDPANTSKHKSQLDNLLTGKYVKNLDINEETNLLELMDDFEAESTTINMINIYKQRNLPNSNITPIDSLDIVKKIHTALKEAMCSDTEYYILESEKIKTRMKQLKESEALIPTDILPLLKTAMLLANSKTDQKNLLRASSLNIQQNYETENMSDITF